MGSDTQPFVSFVTPVYNTADYLPYCIESVLRQTYDNWEYLIVNNQSTDDSLAIAKHFAAKDNRVQIIQTDSFLTQTRNYNFALRHISADSKYCKIVQADDWIFPDCVRQMVALAETDAQIAIVGAYRLLGTRLDCDGLDCGGPHQCTESVMSGRDACRQYMLENHYLFGTQTSVLYRSDLVRSRHDFYIEDSNHADSEVCFELLEGRNFGFVHQVLTFTRVGNDSISTRARNFYFYMVHRYIIILKYGRLYLTPTEYEACLDGAKRTLYQALAWNMFRSRGKTFWEYHEDALRMAGDKLDWSRLYRMQIPRVLNMLGNPKSTVQALWRHFRTRDVGLESERHAEPVHANGQGVSIDRSAAEQPTLYGTENLGRDRNATG